MTSSIQCNEGRQCPLSSANPLPKFCPECGAASASKVVQTNACLDCGHDFGDVTPKFCPECGTKTPPPPTVSDKTLLEVYGLAKPPPGEKAYTDVGDLIARHEAVRGARQQTGRGLTAEELARIERGARSTDPRRMYTGPTPSSEEEGVWKRLDDVDDDPELRQRAGLGVRRVAVEGMDGTHKPGGLSPRGTRLGLDYHEGVRVIEHSFRNPARRAREQLGGGGKTEDEQLSSAEVKAFYETDPADPDGIDLVLNPSKRNS